MLSSMKATCRSSLQHSCSRNISLCFLPMHQLQSCELHTSRLRVAVLPLHVSGRGQPVSHACISPQAIELVAAYIHADIALICTLLRFASCADATASQASA